MTRSGHDRCLLPSSAASAMASRCSWYVERKKLIVYSRALAALTGVGVGLFFFFFFLRSSRYVCSDRKGQER